ncbi:MAG TPA: EamA family transporter [Hanamia sp.]|nr:EamA family transporter [Hanamia sp.]
MQQIDSKNTSLIKVIIAFAIVYLVWGSTYFAVQAAERDFPPFILGALRFLVSGFLLMGWCIFKRYRLFDWKEMKVAFIVGNLLLFIGNGSIIWAEETLPSSLVAVLVSAAPLWFVLFDKRKWRVNFTNKFIITGVFTGFAGVILLFGEKVFYETSTAAGLIQVIALAAVLIGNISWSVGSLYSKYNSIGNTSVSAAWQMIFAGLTFFIVSFFTKEVPGFDFTGVHFRGWMSVIYLICFGSLAGYSAYIWLLQVRPATQVSTNAYVNPVVAVLLGVFFGGETIDGLQIGGLAIILLSVFIINFEKYKSS